MSVCKKCKKEAEVNKDGFCLSCDLSYLIFRQNKNIEDWLMNYSTYKKEYDLKMQEVKAGTKEADENVGGGRSSTPGRPTESMVVSIIHQEESDTAKWLGVIEDVQRTVGAKKLFLLEAKREGKFNTNKGRSNWTSYVQRRFLEAMNYDTDDKYLSKMWREIRDYTARVAIARGCNL